MIVWGRSLAVEAHSSFRNPAITQTSCHTKMKKISSSLSGVAKQIKVAGSEHVGL